MEQKNGSRNAFQSRIWHPIALLQAFLFFLLFLQPSTTVFAQHAESQECRAYVGNLKSIPVIGDLVAQYNLGCGSDDTASLSGSLTGGGSSGGTPGQYRFPLDPNVVTGIATEMAAYPGGYTFGGHREHAGLDIGAPIAGHTPVYSVADGVVIAARDACYNVAIGEQCRLDISNAGDNFISSYSHVDVSPSVRVGTRVQKGQQIAVVHWWTEYSSMDHLHFEFLDKNRIDPLGVGWNINPRNYFPELQRWTPYGYGQTGKDVRNYTNSVGLNWANDGKEYAETYLSHPPCGGDCWAH